MAKAAGVPDASKFLTPEAAMCSCNHSQGYLCFSHRRERDAVLRAAMRCEGAEPEVPAKPRPVPDYLARIRAGQD